MRFGATAAQVQNQFGKPSDDARGFFPKGVVFTGQAKVFFGGDPIRSITLTWRR